jgi:hypothetical protein
MRGWNNTSAVSTRMLNIQMAMPQTANSNDKKTKKK